MEEFMQLEQHSYVSDYNDVISKISAICQVMFSKTHKEKG